VGHFQSFPHFLPGLLFKLLQPGRFFEGILKSPLWEVGQDHANLGILPSRHISVIGGTNPAEYSWVARSKTIQTLSLLRLATLFLADVLSPACLDM
jgi:hypothetical protein